MCFSAQASFAASIGLLLIGIICLKSAPPRKIRLWALFPLIFSVQQAIEGFLWVFLKNGEPTMVHLSYILGLTYGYLFFAYLWWPLFVPVAALITEHIPYRRKLLLGCLASGIIATVGLFSAILKNSPHASILDCHIVYDAGISEPMSWFLGIFYLLATVAPFFIMSIPGMKLIGTAIAIGVLASLIFYYEAFASVWCFFAAIVSLLILFVIRRSGRSSNRRNQAVK